MIEAYHLTTKAGFSRFRIARRDMGIHFGTRAQAADRFNWKLLQGKPIEAAATIPVLLDLSNPLRIDDLGTWPPDRVMDELYIANIPGLDDLREKPTHAQIRNHLLACGYDGLVYPNRGEGPGLSDAAHEEQQIRTAMGLHPYQSSQWLALQQQLHAAGRRLARIRQAAEDSYVVFRPDRIFLRFPR
ncbi:hypothetical protein [Sphingosinicella sp. BN140058]|uniref:hypothetical protein n=1 Tax=Sphingosinicella sp. BN140058 TaxID=1892855 RepID=UPI0010136A14|nr:hypothetical protein [Sphingosinicella sp. BN140058]QAY80430.1 hypothetical protein ETR14_27715 [Sphingosinicella sp. BN140058]